MAKAFNTKRLVIRIVLLALLLALCAFLFYIGKEHDVMLDNKTVTISGQEYKEIPYMTVIVDGDEEREMEFSAGDRDALKLQGPKHSMVIKVIDEQSEKVLKTIEYKMNLGTISSIMLSLPAIVDGAKDVALPIVTYEEQEAAEEQTEEKAKENGLSESPVEKTPEQVDSNKTIEGPTTTE